MNCPNCGSKYCEDQIEFNMPETGYCHDCITPEELDLMNEEENV